MSITTADVTRINFHHKGKENFTVEFDQVEKSLTMKVNGDIRNKIHLADASSGFDKLLELVKNEFLKLRQTQQ